MTNAATIDALTPTTDIYGRTIEIGSLVRSFSNPLLLKDDRILGINNEPTPADSRVSYIDGIVMAIGDAEIEGCQRYTIFVVRDVSTREWDAPPVIETAESIDGLRQIHPARTTVFPPLNGTRSTLGSRTFGVVVL